MSQGTAPKATAQGTLGKTPFAHLLLYIYNRRLSGTLAVWPEVVEQQRGKAQDRVLFREGEPEALKPVQPATSVMEGLQRLFQRRAAPYAFYEGQNWLGREGVLAQRVHPYTALSRGVLEHAREEVIDAVLGKVAGRPLRMRPGVPLNVLQLSPKQAAFVDTLRAAPTTAEALIRSCELPTIEARRVLYLLTLIKGVEAARTATARTFHSIRPPGPGPSSSPPPRSSVPAQPASTPAVTPAVRAIERPPANQGQAEQAPPPAPPPTLQAEERARWEALVDLYSKADELTHYQLLGLTQAATDQEVSRAYLALVKQVHPDRLPAPLAPLRQYAQALFEQATQANDVLTDPSKRDEYVRAVQAGGGTKASERLASAIIESAMLFQKAEVLTRRRDYAQAMELLTQAMALNDDEPDYHALRGFLLHVLNPGEGAPFEEMLASLDRALKGHERSERAHYYKALVLKRMKRESEALEHFRRAAELNPQNVEAAREVRLATMRRNSQPPQSSTGLLSKLFGGKQK